MFYTIYRLFSQIFQADALLLAYMEVTLTMIALVRKQEKQFSCSIVAYEIEQENKQKSTFTKKLKITHTRRMQVYFVIMLIVFNGISCLIPKFQRKFEEGKKCTQGII